MRELVQFQIVPEEAGDNRKRAWVGVWALDTEGTLWHRHSHSSPWRAVTPPDDGDPYAPTGDELEKQIKENIEKHGRKFYFGRGYR